MGKMLSSSVIGDCAMLSFVARNVNTCFLYFDWWDGWIIVTIFGFINSFASKCVSLFCKFMKS